MITTSLKPKNGNDYARLTAIMQSPDEIECVGIAVRNRQYLHEMAPGLFDRVRSLITIASPPLQPGRVIYSRAEYGTTYGTD